MITNDIIIYIENEVKRGVSHEAIGEALVTAGWKALEVADALRVVTEREHAGTTGTPYIPVAAAMLPQKETINQAAVTHTLDAKPQDAFHPDSQLHIAPVADMKPSEGLPMGGFIPGSSAALPEVKIVEEKTVATEKKPEHHKLMPVLIVFGILVLGVAGYFFLSPMLNNPGKKISSVTSIAETAKSIQYSGEYDITAPTGLIFPDRVLISNYGGTSARQTTATIKGAFMGVDDWYDFRSKKNEVKFNTKINVSGAPSMDFSSTSRLVGNALYSKLSESAAIFDEKIANQGANWVRFDEGMDVPMYAYGFWGNANLYAQGFPRALAPYIAGVSVGASQKLPTGETVVSVRYPDAIVTYFNSIFITGDKLGVSGSIGSKYPVSSLTELPSGEITLGPDGVIKKAVMAFAYKTKDYTIPVRIRFTLSFDRFDTPPAINIPSLVVPFASLEKSDTLSDLPEGLQGFFSDVRTIASVYKGTNENSYKGVCSKKGEQTEESTELTVPYVSDKVFASGYEMPVCTDTDTAWSYYTHDPSGYYCTDSRGFSGKAARQPLGDKCN